MKTPISFLFGLWSRTATDGDYVCISTRKFKTKGGKRILDGKGKPETEWKDHFIQYDKQIRMKLRAVFNEFPHEQYDLYFCPTPLSEDSRRRDTVKPTPFLWSDIDNGDPEEMPPSLLWESSKGRYQGIWFLDKTIEPSLTEGLNQRVAEKIGGDNSGWDLTQVLRIPGTTNHKRKVKETVRFMDERSKRYKVGLLKRTLKPTEQQIIQVTDEEIEEFDGAQTRAKLRRYKVPKAFVSSLTNGPDEGEDRSEGFWELAKILAERGVPEDIACQIMKGSPWNKYDKRRNPDKEIRRQVRKAYSPFDVTIKSNIKKTEGEDKFGLVQFDDFVEADIDRPDWLIKDFWVKGEWGMIGGEPKCFKSTLAYDLLYSVASGMPLFGKYEVVTSGPVIYIQNENSAWIMQDRARRFKKNRPCKKNVPLYMLNQKDFMLDGDGLDNLEKMIEEIKPVMVLLDPLMTMFHEDLSSHSELQPILQELTALGRDSGTSIIMVHHSNKSNDPNKRGGSRLMGSQALHGWNANAWYLQNMGDNVIRMERELRGAGYLPKLDITVKDGSMGEDLYEVTVGEAYEDENKSPHRKITEDVMEKDFICSLRSRKSMSPMALQRELGYSQADFTRALEWCINHGICDNIKGQLSLIKVD